MAAVTAAISAGVGLAGMGMSIKQASDAEKARKQALISADAAGKSIENLQTQNAFEGMQIPQLGFNLAQQGIDRQSQSALNSLKGAGSEGILGGVPTINQMNNEQNLALGAQANQLEYARNMAQAGAQQDINSGRTDRLAELGYARLQGSQMMAANAQNNKNLAIQGGFNSAQAGLSHLYDPNTGLPLYRNAKVPVSQAAPAGSFAGTTVPMPDSNTEQSFQGPYYSVGMPTE